MTFKEFEVLQKLASAEKKLSQRELAREAGFSVGTVNTTVAHLSQQGLLQDGCITAAGIDALEPYRVKRAIILAAGFGERLVPITLNTPKSLVLVKGRRIIDSLLDAIVAAGIEQIVIVRGYLREQFDQLLYKYPNLEFVDNPDYNEENNISSVMKVRNLLANSYVCEGDIILHNPRIIQKYQFQSNYCGVKCQRTDDWCFSEYRGRIRNLAVGGENCYQMMGISYWTEDDGSRLSGFVKQVYEAPGGRERFWDTVPLQYYADEFDVAVRGCSFEDFTEIDTFNELKSLDSVYDV
ncbi:MAG: NTP transferase domain-containing protein [Spirochaetaceae bacterium]|nr:NTP transferase domain-containing protein [Spirochaetaceae bacterium]MBQ8560291.1 NTP transferase domain-containing protein [Spirochaetaceae bacterium]